MRRTIQSIGVLVLLVGCAAKPESIMPAYVSDLSYSGYSCEQLRAEQGRLGVALTSASDAQRTARSNDTAGVIFLGLPVSSLSGSNQASNVARLKGELDALQKASIKKDCGLTMLSLNPPSTKKKSNSRIPGTKYGGGPASSH